MKAEELMIGDWVYEGSNHPIQVLANYGRSVRYDEDGSHEVEETCLTPIPLTEKILKKNKFEKHRGLYTTPIQPNLGESVSVLISDSTGIECLDEDIIVHVKYVHELQHILRFCGFNELTNHFVV